MENLLLLWDELDDAATSLRLLWPQLFGFCVALTLFAATVYALLHWPLLVAFGALLIAIVAGLHGIRPLPGLRTDP